MSAALEALPSPGWRPVPNEPGDAIPPAAAPGGSSNEGYRFKAGDRFVLDDPAELDPIWGRGDDVLWARGEPCLIVGPTGVGKTTLALQVVAGLIGLGDSVLGYSVAQSDRQVLYLALDRPRQIRRAMRRIFGAADRQALAERLTVWEGPLPLDLGRAPTTLFDLATTANAGVVVIDSLKDAAVKLTDDETAGNLNRAMQYLVANGIEVLGLHHQRKGQAGAKPTTLEDVYGSTWLTAGAGSVVLLWGAAGDPIVDLRHVKQPAGEVGPLRIEHDALTGHSSLYRATADPLTVLRNRGRNGLNTADLARLMFEVDKPTDNQRKKAQRSLDRLVRDGIAHRESGDRGSAGSFEPSRYYLVADRRNESEL